MKSCTIGLAISKHKQGRLVNIMSAHVLMRRAGCASARPFGASLLPRVRLLSTNSAGDQAAPDEDTTHFGFKTVRKAEKASLVGEIFANVANKYDVMNDAMSVGVHRLWKDHFVARLDPPQGIALLDVAGGTGDIAFRVLDALKEKRRLSPRTQQQSPLSTLSSPTLPTTEKESRVIVCDINPSMLAVGKMRGKERGYRDESELAWVVGDAERLPIADASVDCYTIAFGIRNVTDVPAALREAHRVLVRGGRFMCLEFSHVTVPALREAYDAYSFNAIPALGQFIAGDRESYQYLVESIRRFPDQQTFAGMIRDAGFRFVQHENLTFGVAAIHSGIKL